MKIYLKKKENGMGPRADKGESDFLTSCLHPYDNDTRNIPIRVNFLYWIGIIEIG